MKKQYFITNFFIGVVCFGFFMNINSAAQTSDFNDALKKAKDENKRVIVDVYTDWCGWCKKMDTDAYGNKKVKNLIKNNFVFIKLNAESDNKLKYKGIEYS